MTVNEDKTIITLSTADIYNAQELKSVSRRVLNKKFDSQYHNFAIVARSLKNGILSEQYGNLYTFTIQDYDFYFDDKRQIAFKRG